MHIKINIRLFILVTILVSFLCSPKTFAESEFIKQVNSLPVARGFHGTVVLGDFLYVIGGSALVDDLQVPAITTHVARIFPDGQLSQFLTTSRLPQSRHYISNSTLVLNDTVYVIGGGEEIVGGANSKTIAWTRPTPSGMLEPWRESAPFPQTEGLNCMVSISTPGYLHVLGGADKANNVHKEVWSIKVNPDGSLGQWEAGPSLPAPLWFHMGAVVGGRAYIWGGLDYYAIGEIPYACQNIYSAPILSSGRLGKWRVESTKLPTGLYAASTATAGPYVFCISPRYQGGEISSDLWWTYVTPQGMTEWKRIETQLPNKLYRAAATDYRRGIIYVSGGKTKKGTVPIVDQFLLKLSPQVKSLAEKSWLATQSSAQVASIEYGSQNRTQLSFSASSAGSIPGFYQLDAARSLSQQKKRPLVMYFYSEAAIPCQKQLEVIQTEEFSNLLNQAVFCAINPQKFPQFAQQYAVFRVPTWVCFNSDEEERGRLIGAQSFEALSSAINALE
jgi:hypothetical protein